MLIALITFPPFLFYSFLLCCSLLFSIRSLFLFLFRFDWFGFLSFLSVKVVAVSLRWDDESFGIESFNLYSLLLSCFPSPHTRSSSSSSSSSDVLPMYYSRVVYSFTLPLVCVYSISPHARWKEWRCVWKLFKQTMRSFVLSTYTLKPYGIHPSLFKSRVFFVFSFFFLFPFERYGIATVEWNTTERVERERNKKI